MTETALTPKPQHEVVLEAGRADRHYWLDLWRYRELFQVLAWRDVAIRYKQTVFGVAWAVIRPLLATIIFSLLMGRVAKLPSDGGAPYPLMVFAGMLPWTFFSQALADASNSVVSNANLVSKVYFPRLIVPTATIVAAMVDFAIGLVILAGMMLWFRFVPDWRILLLPAFALMGFLAALGPSLWIASLNVRYRDFRYVIPFIVQFGLYVSPVAYSSSVVPARWRLLYSVNPMASVIDGFRWCVLGGRAAIYWPGFGLGVAVIALAIWLGVTQFRRLEKSFADLI
ncbi:MAG TPA: ABC transporter permease [Caulobacteraceae bacterium]|jgi:lipopolysaccharide transport system permease protein